MDPKSNQSPWSPPDYPRIWIKAISFAGMGLNYNLRMLALGIQIWVIKRPRMTWTAHPHGYNVPQT